MLRDDQQRPSTTIPPEGDAQMNECGDNIGRSLAIFVELTGLTRDQIRDGFRADPPRTLVDLAVAEGVSQSELVAATVADTRLRLHEAVASGRISAQRADERLANLEANVIELVTTIPFGPSTRSEAAGGVRW